MRTIERSELQALLALDENAGQKVRVLEALPPKYFHQGHLPGAKQLDHANAAGHARLLQLAPGDRIVVYCASDTCANSHQAAQALAAAGFTDVAVYVGGKRDWTGAGLALEGAREAA